MTKQEMKKVIVAQEQYIQACNKRLEKTKKEIHLVISTNKKSLKALSMIKSIC